MITLRKYLFLIALVTLFNTISFAQTNNWQKNPEFIPFETSNDSLNKEKIKQEINMFYQAQSSKKTLLGDYNSILKVNDEWIEYKSAKDKEWEDTMYNLERRLFDIQWKLKDKLSKIKQEKNTIRALMLELESDSMMIEYKKRQSIDLEKRKTDIKNEFKLKKDKLSKSIVIIGSIKEAEGIDENKLKEPLVNQMMTIADTVIYKNYQGKTFSNNSLRETTQKLKKHGDASILEDYFSDLKYVKGGNNPETWILKIIRFNVFPFNQSIDDYNFKSIDDYNFNSDAKATEDKINYEMKIYYYDETSGKIINAERNTEYNISDANQIKIFDSILNIKETEAQDFLLKIIEHSKKYNKQNAIYLGQYAKQFKKDTKETQQFINTVKKEIDTLNANRKNKIQKLNSFKEQLIAYQEQSKKLEKIFDASINAYKKHINNRYRFVNKLETWNIKSGKPFPGKANSSTSVPADIAWILAVNSYTDKNRQLSRKKGESQSVITINQSGQEFTTTNRTEISYYSAIIGFKILSLNIFEKQNDNYIACNIAFKTELSIRPSLIVPDENSVNEKNLLFTTSNNQNDNTKIKWFKFNEFYSYIDYQLYEKYKPVNQSLPTINELKMMIETVKQTVFDSKDTPPFLPTIMRYIDHPIISCETDKVHNTIQAIKIVNKNTFEYKVVTIPQGDICSIVLVKRITSHD